MPVACRDWATVGYPAKRSVVHLDLTSGTNARKAAMCHCSTYGDAPVSVEIGEAGAAVNDVTRPPRSGQELYLYFRSVNTCGATI